MGIRSIWMALAVYTGGDYIYPMLVSTCGMRTQRKKAHRSARLLVATGPTLSSRDEKHRGVAQRTSGQSRKRLGHVAQEAREWCHKTVINSARQGDRIRDSAALPVKPRHGDGPSRRYYRVNLFGKNFDSNAGYSRRMSNQRPHAKGSIAVRNVGERREATQTGVPSLAATPTDSTKKPDSLPRYTSSRMALCRPTDLL